MPLYALLSQRFVKGLLIPPFHSFSKFTSVQNVILVKLISISLVTSFASLTQTTAADNSSRGTVTTKRGNTRLSQKEITAWSRVISYSQIADRTAPYPTSLASLKQCSSKPTSSEQVPSHRGMDIVCSFGRACIHFSQSSCSWELSS